MKGSTLNPKEVSKFTKISKEWWNPNGKLKTLHQMNPIRIEYIMNQWKNTSRSKNGLHTEFSSSLERNTLHGVRVLDCGCGGGIVSENLARLGGEVVGLDAGEENVQVARLHAKQVSQLYGNGEGMVRYEHGLVEHMPKDQRFQLIVCLEVLEHVENPYRFLDHLTDLLDDDGLMVLSTINQTMESYLKLIVGAEYMTGIVPIGTHDWNKFINPRQLENYFQKEFEVLDVSGLDYNPFCEDFYISASTGANYFMTVQKRSKEPSRQEIEL